MTVAKCKAVLRKASKDAFDVYVKDDTSPIAKRAATYKNATPEQAFAKATEYYLGQLQRERTKIATSVSVALKAEAPAPKPAPTARPATLEKRITALQNKIADAEEEGKPTEQMQKRLEDLLVEKEMAALPREKMAVTEEEESVGDIEGEEVMTPFGPGTKTTLSDENEGPFGRYGPLDGTRSMREVLTKPDVTLASMLDDIITNSPNGVYKMLARVLKGLNLKTTVEFKDGDYQGDPNSRVAGEYVEEEDRIDLYRHGANEMLVMHETLHAGTLAMIRKAEAALEKKEGLTKEEARVVDAYKQMQHLHAEAHIAWRKRHGGGPTADTIPYGLGFYGKDTIAEFVAATMTDPEIQEFLRSVPSRVDASSRFVPSLWVKLVDAIKFMLGLDQDDNSVMARILETVPAFFSKEASRQPGSLFAEMQPPVGNSGVVGAAALNPAELQTQTLLGAITNATIPFTGQQGREKQQLLRNTEPKARLPIPKTVSAAASDPRYKEGLRRFKKGVANVLREVTTVRFNAARSAGFAAIQNLANAYNEFKTTLRTRYNNSLAPLFKLPDEDYAVVSDMILATTLNKMRGIKEDFIVQWVRDGKAIDMEDPKNRGVGRRIPVPELVALGKYTAEEFAAGIKSALPGFGDVTFELKDDARSKRVWKAYNAAMDTMFQGAVDRMNGIISSESDLAAIQMDATLRQHIHDETLRLKYEAMLKKMAEAYHRMANEKPGTTGGRTKQNKASVEAANEFFKNVVNPILRGEGTEADIAAIVEKSGLTKEEVDAFWKGAQQEAARRSTASEALRDKHKAILDQLMAAQPKLTKEKLLYGKANVAELKTLAEAVGVSEEEMTELNKEIRGELAQRKARGEQAFTTDDAKKLLEQAKTFALLADKKQETMRTAVKSIAGGYVPLYRSGKYQTMGAYVGEDGKTIKASRKFKEALPFFRSDNATDLEEMVGQWNAAQGQTEFEVEVNVQEMTTDEEGNEKTTHTVKKVKAKLVMLPVKGVPDQASLKHMPYEEVIRSLEGLGEQVPEDLRHRLIEHMTNAESFHRKSLEREGHPGFSFDTPHIISQHLQTLSAMVAHKKYYPRISQIVAGDERTMPEFWGNGKVEIAQARRAYDEAGASADKGTEAYRNRVRVAHRNLMQVAEQFFGQGKLVSAQLKLAQDPENKVLQAKVEKLQQETDEYIRLEAPEIKKQARLYTDWLNESGYNEDPTHWRTFKTVSTVLQLGLSFSTAVTNLSSLALHTFSTLATYNETTGFGGGFGAKATFDALTTAGKMLGPLMKDTFIKGTLGEHISPEEYFKEGIEKVKAIGREMAAQPKEPGKTYPQPTYLGYPLAAWEFMLDMSESGVLAPQRFNEMMGQAGRAQYNDKMGKWSGQMMSMFAATEEFNRQTTALAAYTLYHKQAQDSNLSREPYTRADGIETTEFDEYIKKNVEEVVYASQGNYGMQNRPRLFRGDVTSIIFMYKTFAVTSAELLANLPRSGQAMFLGTLWFAAGAQGIPYWEELMTVLDTITQRTGGGLSITKGNAERTFEMALRDLGLDKVVMHGVLDTLTGMHIFGNAGIRLGIPLLGLGRAGTDFETELGKALGPTVGLARNSLKAATALSNGDLETALRLQPVTGVRHLAEAFSAAKYDAFLNKRGQVVVDDLNPFHIIARALGWSPQALTESNDMVRKENITREFSKEIKTQLIEKGRKLEILRDSEGLRDLKQTVKEHNDIFRGTALEIRDFDSSLKQAAKQAKMSLEERTIRTLPKTQRAEYERELGAQ